MKTVVFALVAFGIGVLLPHPYSKSGHPRAIAPDIPRSNIQEWPRPLANAHTHDNSPVLESKDYIALYSLALSQRTKINESQRSGIARFWGRRDPQSALAFASKLSDGEADTFRFAVLQGWAENDLNGAWKWFLESDLLEKDPSSAAERARLLVASHDFLYGAEVTASLESDAQSYQRVKMVGKARREGADAVFNEILASSKNQDGALRSFVSGIASIAKDPRILIDTAEVIASRCKSPEQQKELLLTLMTNAHSAEALTAVDYWASQMPPGALRQRCLETVALKQISVHPGRALQIAESQTDEMTKQTLVSTVLIQAAGSIPYKDVIGSLQTLGWQGNDPRIVNILSATLASLPEKERQAARLVLQSSTIAPHIKQAVFGRTSKSYR